MKKFINNFWLKKLTKKGTFYINIFQASHLELCDGKISWTLDQKRTSGVLHHKALNYKIITRKKTH